MLLPSSVKGYRRADEGNNSEEGLLSRAERSFFLPSSSFHNLSSEGVIGWTSTRGEKTSISSFRLNVVRGACNLANVPAGRRWLLLGVSSDETKFCVLMVNPLLLVVSEVASREKLDRPVLREPDTDVDIVRLDDVAEGSGSGISIDSSSAPPRRAVSVEQLFSFTITGLALCQHKLVTA